MLEGKEADRRDDVYSFACVIHEILCGERPFGDLTALEAREEAAQMPPLQGLSRAQNAAFAQALAIQREARSASAEKLLGDLPARCSPHLLGANRIELTPPPFNNAELPIQGFLETR